MKFLLTIVSLAAGLVAAQDLSEIPECALPCIYSAVASATECSATDYKCWCTQDNESIIAQAGTACVVAKCGPDVAEIVLSAAQQFCWAVNAS